MTKSKDRSKRWKHKIKPNPLSKPKWRNDFRLNIFDNYFFALPFIWFIIIFNKTEISFLNNRCHIETLYQVSQFLRQEMPHHFLNNPK